MSRSTTACGRRSSRRASRISARRGATVHLASDDGSIGYRASSRSCSHRTSRREHLFGCGPEPMLHALAKLAPSVGRAVSRVAGNADGLRRRHLLQLRDEGEDTDGGWDYKRVCVDGPVFDAACLVWEC